MPWWPFVSLTVYDREVRRADKLQEQYDALVNRVLLLDRQKAIVHPPPPSDELKAKKRESEAAVRGLASELRSEQPGLSLEAATAEAKRLLRVAGGEEE